MKWLLFFILLMTVLCDLRAEEKQVYELMCGKISSNTHEKLCSLNLNDMNKKAISIQVAVSELDQHSRYRNFNVWGADLQFAPAKNFISEIKVEIDGEKSGMPLSSFADLSNVYAMTAMFNKEKFIIKVEGGETSTHYFATIAFDYEGFILERNVDIPTFSGLGEKTIYHWNRLDN